MKDQRHAVLILGIARSGTSAVAGALSAAGVNFGDDLKSPDWQNPHGSIEDFTLSRMNQDILAAAGRSWSSLRAMPNGWRQAPEIHTLETALRERLVQKFGDSPLFGVKDPRLVPLFQLYDDLLRDLGIKVWTVATEREQRQVLRSIRKSGYYHGRLQSLGGPLLYRKYAREIAQIADKRSVHTVNYTRLIEKPRETIEALCAVLPFTDCGIMPDIARATASVDPALYRNRT